MKVLVATEKPFAAVAVDGIRKVIAESGYELQLLEKYSSKADLLGAVADADAVIIRSDVIDAEVLDAAKRLRIVVRAGADMTMWTSLLPQPTALWLKILRARTPMPLPNWYSVWLSWPCAICITALPARR